jgi:integrase
LRRAEALGLRWSDVGLDAHHLSVSQTLAYVGTRPTFSDPNTDSSRRLVTLAPETVESLNAHRARQAEERAAIGPSYALLDLVFGHGDGTPLNPATVSRAFDAVVADAELPRITLHGAAPYVRDAGACRWHPVQDRRRGPRPQLNACHRGPQSHVTPGMKDDGTARVALLRVR